MPCGRKMRRRKKSYVTVRYRSAKTGKYIKTPKGGNKVPWRVAHRLRKKARNPRIK